MNEYRDIYKSVFRFANEVAEELQFSGYEFSVLNMETFASPTDWPENHFIGVDEVRIEYADARAIAIFMALVISTRDDKNLMIMNDVTNTLVNKLTPSKRIPIYSSETGLIRGHMVVRDGTRVDACVQTDSQPARPIFVALLSDQLTMS